MQQHVCTKQLATNACHY